MHLKILLPTHVFADVEGVLRVVIETLGGSFGFLPHRLDCAAALASGLLLYETEKDGEVYIAVDQGIIVKVRQEVFVSVRNAVGGVELGKLHSRIRKGFLLEDESERQVRTALVKLETAFARTFLEFHRD